MEEQGTGLLEVELPGTGEPILDGGAELLFRREFETAFARLTMAWWSRDPATLAEGVPG